MAKKRDDQLWNVTMEGEYFCNEGGHSVQKHYEVTEMFSQKMVDYGVQSVWKNQMAPEVMPRKYPGYTGLYTYRIKLAHPVGDKDAEKPLKLQNRQELLAYIDENEYPIEVILYKDTDSLRQAIMDWETARAKKEEQRFIEHQERLLEIHGKRLEMENEVERVRQLAEKAKQQEAEQQSELAESPVDDNDQQQDEPTPKPKRKAKAASSLADIV